MPNAIDSPLYERALLLAMELLALLDAAADTPTPIMLSKFTFIILDELKEARSLGPGFHQPSAN